MSNPPSSTGRLIDDDPSSSFGTPRPRPTVVPTSAYSGEPPRLSASPGSPQPPVPLQAAQRACYEALGLALQEGHVFAAVTGPEGSGKTTVLEAVLADRHDRALRCIRISDPDKVPSRLASQIEQVAYTEAAKPENLERHVVLAIDDAHTASNELLGCLARLAAMREPGRRVPQVLLVGRPELWSRLATEEYAPLARRLAIRAVLPTLMDEQDPWASLEQEVSQTMSQLRGEHLPAQTAGANMSPLFDRAFSDNYPTTVEEAGLPFDPATVPPPTDYALFPDPPPRARKRQRESKRWLLLPLGCLMAGVATFTFVLSFFDWPGLFDDMPWADSKPAASNFAFNAPAGPPGLPQMPAWAQPTQRALPRGAPPSPTASSAQAAAHPAPPPVVTPPPAPSVAPPASQQAVASAPAEHTASGPKPAEPAPAAVVTAAPALAEPVKPAELPKPTEAAVKPPEPPKPVATAAAEPSLTSLPPITGPTNGPTPVVPVSAPKPEPAKPAPAPEPPMTMAALAAPPLTATAQRSSRAAPIAVVKPAPLPPAIVGLLLRRGDEQLAIGDVSAARLLFERAAESGNAQGAFRLARTYDTNYLPAADAATLGNRAEARIWYGRAASLGDREAASRLRDLNAGR